MPDLLSRMAFRLEIISALRTHIKVELCHLEVFLMVCHRETEHGSSILNRYDVDVVTLDYL